MALPGAWEDDAVPFALRTTLALLLAYGVSFAIQLDSASSAGITVAIVAQSTPGMSLSKAAYRVAGTLLGGVAGLVLVAAYAQDRTMLLTGFTLWLGACTFVASLLRDFRAYGAVLAGYTVGIVAVGNIDTPDAAFLSALNRVAAVLIGVSSMAAVNTLLSPPSAYLGVVGRLEEWRVKVDALADAAVAGGTMPDSAALTEMGAAILALRTEAGYAALEVPGGRQQRQAAGLAIAGLLGMLSAARGLGRANVQAPSRAREVFRAERMSELRRQRLLAADGLTALRDRRPPRGGITLGTYRDVVTAWINAVRTMVAVAAGCLFCVVAGWPGATLLLIQQAAFTALFGMQPNPTAAAVSTAACIPTAALAAFIVGFVLLPDASGFIPFALAFAPFAFAFTLVARHRTLGPFGPGLLLYLTLLLSPANTEAFDLGAFVQNVFVQFVAVFFMVAAFTLVLPVSPSRRLMRVADSMGESLHHALDGCLKTQRRLHPIITARTRRYDRLATARIWLGRHTPARLSLLDRMCQFAELEGALLRAAHGLRLLNHRLPRPDAGAMLAQAEALADTGDEPHGLGVDLAVSGLHEAGLLLQEQTRALRHYGLLARSAPAPEASHVA